MKKSGSGAKNAPQILVPASPSAFKRAMPASAAQGAPEVQEITRQDMVAALIGMAPGWDRYIEGMLKIPDNLFRMSLDSGTFYSKGRAFGLAAVIEGLRSEKLPSPLPEYGICLYSTGGSEHLVLVDGDRNFIVHARMFSIHGPFQANWPEIKESLRLALGVSEEARKQGGVAVFDGTLRIVRQR